MSGPLLLVLLFALAVALWGLSGRIGQLFAPRRYSSALRSQAEQERLERLAVTREIERWTGHR